jgi:hypothetical protein
MHASRALTYAFLFCSFPSGLHKTLCLLVEAPMLVCVPSDCFAPFTVLPLLVGAHFMFSGGLGCVIRAHACSSAVFTLCSSASFLYIALLVFCMVALHLWVLCSYVPVALLFALWQCT